jgi:hypothetical protein
MANELIYYNAARNALQQAASIDEVKDVKDKAAAMKLYAAQQNDKEMEKWAAQIKTRAMRRIGELCLELDKAENHYARSNSGTTKTNTLTDAGISKTEALEVRW